MPPSSANSETVPSDLDKWKSYVKFGTWAWQLVQDAAILDPEQFEGIFSIKFNPTIHESEDSAKIDEITQLALGTYGPPRQDGKHSTFLVPNLEVFKGMRVALDRKCDLGIKCPLLHANFISLLFQVQIYKNLIYGRGILPKDTVNYTPDGDEGWLTKNLNVFTQFMKACVPANPGPSLAQIAITHEFIEEKLETNGKIDIVHHPDEELFGDDLLTLKNSCHGRADLESMLVRLLQQIENLMNMRKH